MPKDTKVASTHLYPRSDDNGVPRREVANFFSGLRSPPPPPSSLPASGGDSVGETRWERIGAKKRGGLGRVRFKSREIIYQLLAYYEPALYDRLPLAVWSISRNRLSTLVFLIKLMNPFRGEIFFFFLFPSWVVPGSPSVSEMDPSKMKGKAMCRYWIRFLGSCAEVRIIITIEGQTYSFQSKAERNL